MAGGRGTVHDVVPATSEVDDATWLAALGRALTVHGAAALGVFDEQLRHVLVSPLLAAMNGATADELRGRTPMEVHGASVAEAQKMYAQVLASGEPVLGSAFSAAIPSTPDVLRHWVLDCLPLPPGGPRGVVVLVTEVTELVKAQAARDEAWEQLRRQAERDALTGLLNRTGLESRLVSGQRYDVVFLDLDGFKEVNDRGGHLFGDGVLADVARRLEAVLDDDELLARVGGDEFVAVTDGDGRELARRLEAATDHVVQAGRRAVRVTASCGVATADVGEPLDEALARADERMYAAKAVRETNRGLDHPV